MGLPRSDLADLLDRPPRGVTVRRELDAVEIHLWKTSWVPWWGCLSLGCLLFGLPIWLGLDPNTYNPFMSAAILFILLVLPGALLTVLSLVGWSLDRMRRPCRILLTGHQVEIEEASGSRATPLESIDSLAAYPWPERGSSRKDRPGRLDVLARPRRYGALRSVPLDQLQWIAAVLEAAVQQRKAALLAAGHDVAALARPPAEAAALRAMTRRASEPPRG